MNNLIVDVDQYSEDIPGSWDPEDEWDCPDQEYRFQGIRIRMVRKLDEYGTHDVPGVKAGDIAYVLTANYNSGCSFNSSYGHTDVVGVFRTANEAADLYRVLTEDPMSDRVDYHPWVGYFESLNHFDIYMVLVS